MADPGASAVALARMRALGDAPVAVVPAASAAARAAGREIVTVTAGGAPVARLAWPADIDLTEQAGSSLWPAPPTALQLTFAACVRLCWEDVHLSPYPGRGVAPEAVFALLARLNARPAADEAIAIFDNAPKRSLTWLRRTAWLDPDDADVRFGTRVAALSDDDVAALRRVYEAMPEPEPGTARPEPLRLRTPDTERPSSSGHPPVEDATHAGEAPDPREALDGGDTRDAGEVPAAGAEVPDVDARRREARPGRRSAPSTGEMPGAGADGPVRVDAGTAGPGSDGAPAGAEGTGGVGGTGESAGE